MTARYFPWLTAGWLLMIQLSAMSARCDDMPRTPDAEASNRDPNFNKDQHRRWIEFYRKEAETYRFYYGDDRAKQLTREPDPVLLYTNPLGARGLTHGAVFVWTHEGRSEMIGAIWSHANTPQPNQRSVSHEFHSLSDQPLTAERESKVVWATTRAGIEWIARSDSPEPASSKSRRMVQMRNLARELTVTQHDSKDASKDQLRLLTQPLYRYEQSFNDGSVFAFCEVWDPEVFVVVESRETGDGRRWFYAPVRFSHLTLAAQHQRKEVWRDERDGPRHRDSNLGYKLFYKLSVESEEL